MAYATSDGQVTLSCDTATDPLCMGELTATIRRGETALQVIRRLWTTASARGWESTSTEHTCFPCGNPSEGETNG